MTDIIIYTTEGNLTHKKGLKKGEEKYSEFYWTFSRLPKRLDQGDKVYFATKGFIRGYFIVLDISKYANHYAGVPANHILWRKSSWVDIKTIPTKSFQGFKYADKVPELDAKMGVSE